MNVILCGFMGSGKTTVGKLLAEHLGMDFVDTDLSIEADEEKSVSKIFEENGEEHFRDLEYNKCVEISKRDSLVVATGGGALTFDRNADTLKNNGIIIYLDVPFEVVLERVGDGETRPLFNDKEKAMELFNQRKDKYEKNCNFTVDGSENALKVSYTIFEMLFDRA